MKTKASSRVRIGMPKIGAVYGIALFLLLFSILTGGRYITATNIINILRQSATLCVLSIAAFLAIITHQTDLSVGAVASLAGMVAALLLKAGTNVVMAMLCAILAGVAMGLVNGLLAGRTTIPPFIITLATMNIAESIGMVLNNGTVSVQNPVFKFINDTTLFGFLPFPALISFALYGLFFWVLSCRRFGTYLYAVGGKEEAALTAGISVSATKLKVYLINGALAGTAGIIYTARLTAANPSQAIGLELDAICSAVLGGAALTGGRGKVQGALLGALAITILRNGMNIMGVRIITQMAVIGLTLIIILAFDVFTNRYQDRRILGK